jgi:beta-lactamase class A
MTMRKWIRPTCLLTTLLTLVLIIGAGSLIGQPQAASLHSQSFVSTVTKAITALPLQLAPFHRFPAGSRVAGVDVGERTPAEATALVQQTLAAWNEPLPLVEDARVPDPQAPLLDLEVLGVVPDVPTLIDQAVAQARNGEPVDVAWQPDVDTGQLRDTVAAIVSQAQQTVAHTLTNDGGTPPNVTFHAQPYQALDVDATTTLLGEVLRDPNRPFTRTAVMRTAQSHGTLAQLEAALRQQIQTWDGVAAVTVHDLETDEWLGINDGSVFAGASVMKVPIMVYAYAKLGHLDAQQQAWLEAMIMHSSNSTANNLLAAGAGGQGTEAALRGAQEMTEMLHELSLQHTYHLVPYESADWLEQRGLLPQVRPDYEGPEPYTEAGRFIRTTPREMAQFFTMLAQCAQGEGPLLHYRDGAITRDACVEMMNWLGRPHDTERMMAGIPDDVKVAHKGGWLTDMQADVGIVFSPNRTYVAAIYLWRDGLVSDSNASPSPYLGALSHTIYSFYNPE